MLTIPHGTVEPAVGTSVRRSEPRDVDRLMTFLDRCSDATIRRRFHGPPGPGVRRELERIATSTPLHRSWVAVGPDGEVHGTATLAWAPTGPPHVAFLVEDAWFRRGIGRSLAAAVRREAVRAGVAATVATIQADNRPAMAFLRALDPAARPRFSGAGELEVTLSVPGLAAAGDRSAGPTAARPGPAAEAAA